MLSAMFGTNSTKRPPKSEPRIEATPPATMPTKRVIETKRVKLSGATNSTATAESDPAIPVIMAETAKARVLSWAMSMPIASAAVGWSRVAISARPMRPRIRFQARRNSTAEMPTATRYIHWSGVTGRKAGGSGFTRNSPCTPPVQSSSARCFSSCGTATASAKVVSAR
jgi:hypothetical protein